MLHFHNGTLILPNGMLEDGVLQAVDSRISFLGPKSKAAPPSAQSIDLQGGYLAPGFVDLHVHGGGDADFMDGTLEAFQTICQVHARHGTTSFTPTTAVARHEQHLRFLECCRHFRTNPTGGTKILGAHLYGPYFALEARGCHPAAPVRPPTPQDYEPYFNYLDDIRTATVAPELPGAEEFVHNCRLRQIRCNAGHSWATFEQMEQAIRWGVRHVDHLFCAMSDRARLRQFQTYPMRGGVMEATLYFDELTTEVIADGKHLQPELLKLAYKAKGPDRLALVTDASRALDMPDGEYIFAAMEDGERFIKRDGVGLTPDGKALASSVMGMDHCVRTFLRGTGVPLHEVIRMASLTPARILGLDADIGSLEVGKSADLIELDRDLQVRRVFVDGRMLR
jgi:N-acetylglucosamine-6-phosphate deacetylase